MVDSYFCAAWEETVSELSESGSTENPESFGAPPELRYLNYLLPQLPPVVARKKIPRIFGGAVSVGTLANADSKGKGPRNRFYIGRTVVYPTVFLLEWLEARGVCPQVTTDWRMDD